VNGYPTYSVNLEMERLPMLTDSRRSTNESTDKHDVGQPDHTDELSTAVMCANCFYHTK